MHRELSMVLNIEETRDGGSSSLIIAINGTAIQTNKQKNLWHGFTLPIYILPYGVYGDTTQSFGCYFVVVALNKLNHKQKNRAKAIARYNYKEKETHREICTAKPYSTWTHTAVTYSYDLFRL